MVTFKPRRSGCIYYGELRHLEYRLRHSPRVFLVLHDPERNVILRRKINRTLSASIALNVVSYMENGRINLRVGPPEACSERHQ